MELKYYKCSHCGNIITFAKASGVPVMCCGQPMEEMVPGTTDAALEKHVPAVEAKDGCVFVKVGEVEHPMLEEHYIEWIALQTKRGVQTKYLQPGEKPEACFCVCEGDEVEAVFEHCNLHGLWKK